MRWIKTIFKKHNINMTGVQPLSGGDINEVYKVDSASQSYVIKLNSATQYPTMFEKEARSLQLLADTKSFAIPEVIDFGEFEDQTYLIMTHLSSGQRDNFAEDFAVNLARLHRHRSEAYGLDFDNFIGRLPQYNLPKASNPLDFYIQLRLEPQFKLARQNGFTFENLDRFYNNLEHIIPDEKASLIHGDLWSGNYLITEAGKTSIYDPAIAYAPREMDIAMMQLFGGYPRAVFDIYSDIFPLQKDWEYRIKLWQLYYILVHVNLFGVSYYSRAKAMLAKYST